MVRFALSLAAAAVIAVSGYSLLGSAAHATPRPALKVIAVVVAHAHHHPAIGAIRPHDAMPVVQ